MACTASACQLVPGATTPAGPGTPGEEAAAPRSAEEGHLDAILLDLADGALERGELDAAENRYRRVLTARPRSVRARVGIGRVALARGRPEAARAQFEAVLETDPQAAEAHLGLADVEQAAGDATAARQHLSAVIAADPRRADVHARLQALTGPAPAGPASSDQELADRASAHPYDPRVLLRAADALARDDQSDAAIGLLSRILWLGDLDPVVTRRAAARLRELSPRWKARRFVEVYVYADESFRQREGWRFVVRDAWRTVSISLMGILDTCFVPVAIRPFESAGSTASLDEIHARVRQAAQPMPPSGIVAGFTGRETPSARGYTWKLGIAQLLGNRLTVRVVEDEVPVRVLAHEVLHLYGAIHVSDEVPSIMNPEGEVMVLDAFNQRILAQTRARRFFGNDFNRNVVAHVDLQKTIDAYLGAVGANIHLRNLGLTEALASARRSRYVAAGRARRAQQLDPHLADMAWIVARMMLLAGRRVEALVMMENAAQLYGPGSPRGRRSMELAEALRRNLVRELQGP